MNFKQKISVLFVMLFLFSFSLTVFAENCSLEEIEKSNNGTINWVDETGALCKCVIETSNAENEDSNANADGTQGYIKVCENVDVEGNSVNSKNDEDSLTIKNKPSQINQNDCKDQIKEYNIRIKEESKNLVSELKNIKKEYLEAYNLVKRNYNDLQICIKQSLSDSQLDIPQNSEDSQTNTSNITGNVVYANAQRNVNTSVEKIKAQVQNMVASSGVALGVVKNNSNETYQAEEMVNFLDDIEQKSANILEDLENNIVSTNEEIYLEECSNEYDQYNVSKEELISLLNTIRDLKEEKFETINIIKELVNERNQVFRDCYNLSVNNSNCEVPLELQNRERELSERLKFLKQDLETSETSETDENSKSLELDRLYKEYLDVKRKIESIKKSCNTQSFVVSEINNMCDEKKQILQDMDSIKEEMVQSDDKKRIFEYETKLNYLEQKLSIVYCANTDNIKDMSKTKEAIKQKINVNANDRYARCIEQLENNNISSEVAKQACKIKISEEEDQYKAKINQLENKIKAQNKIIADLSGNIKRIKNNFANNVNAQEKKEIFEENKEDIKEHTLVVIESLISKLEKQIEQLENSSLEEDTKAEYIEKINILISELKYYSEEIEYTQDTTQLKEFIIEVRKKHIELKKEISVIEMKQRTSHLLKIMNKYYKDSEYYNDLELLSNQLQNKVTNMNSNQINSESIIEINSEYNQLKNKLRSLANLKNEDVNNEVNE